MGIRCGYVNGIFRMKGEAEIFPIDTDDLNTAKKIKIVTVLETENEKKVFINYTTLIGRINKIK